MPDGQSTRSDKDSSVPSESSASWRDRWFGPSKPKPGPARPQNTPRSSGAQTEADFPDDFLFHRRAVRMAFVRKVFAVLLMQFLITIAVVCIFYFLTGDGALYREYLIIFIIVAVVLLITAIVISCFSEVRRTPPWNYLLLTLITICLVLVFGIATFFMPSIILLMFLGLTSIICLLLILFTLQKKWDVTSCLGFVIAGLVILIFLILMGCLASHLIIYAVIAAIGALLYCVYLIVDVQLMINGRHRVAITPHEIALAVILLYVDLSRVFILLLKIIGLVTSRR